MMVASVGSVTAFLVAEPAEATGYKNLAGVLGVWPG